MIIPHIRCSASDTEVGIFNFEADVFVILADGALLVPAVSSTSWVAFLKLVFVGIILLWVKRDSNFGEVHL